MIFPLLHSVLVVALLYTTVESRVSHAGGGLGREEGKTCEAYRDVAITYKEVCYMHRDSRSTKRTSNFYDSLSRLTSCRRSSVKRLQA